MLGMLGQALICILIAVSLMVGLVVMAVLRDTISARAAERNAPRCLACHEGRLECFWSSQHQPVMESYYRCVNCSAIFRRLEEPEQAEWQPVEACVLDETELRRHYGRKANRMVLQDDPPHPFTSDREELCASRFGEITVGLPGEEWPTSGRHPMMGLCQINCAELPYWPDALSDVALVAIFVEDDLGSGDTGDRWLVRTYPVLEGLAPLKRPGDPADRRRMWIRWEPIEEDWRDPSDLPPEIERDVLCSDTIQLFQGHYVSKVGGWPTFVQGPPAFPDQPIQPEFLIQIVDEPRVGWASGDAGVVYFGRNMEHPDRPWVIEMQSC